MHDDFAPEVAALPREVQTTLAERVAALMEFGPGLGRPAVDTLKGSAFTNMKELRFYANDGVWRIAFAFDPTRAAILLVAGDKGGVAEKRFYRWLIETADARYEAHLQWLSNQPKKDI